MTRRVAVTNVEIDAGIQYFAATATDPNRYSPVLRIADGRDKLPIVFKDSGPQYVQDLKIYHPRDSTGNYLPVTSNDLVDATVQYVVNRRTRLVTFRVVAHKFPGSAAGTTMVAYAPLKTSIRGDWTLGNPTAKNVIALAQNRRGSANPMRFTNAPPDQGWPNGYYADGSYARGIAVTEERLIDGGSASYWRDYYTDLQRTALYVSKPPVTATETGGQEPTTLMSIQH